MKDIRILVAYTLLLVAFVSTKFLPKEIETDFETGSGVFFKRRNRKIVKKKNYSEENMEKFLNMKDMKMSAKKLMPLRNPFPCGKLGMTSESCPPDWDVIYSTCILYHNQSASSWSAARQKCSALGGDLLQMPTSTEAFQDYFQAITALFPFTDKQKAKFWIGLRQRSRKEPFKWTSRKKENTFNWTVDSNKIDPSKNCAVIEVGGLTPERCNDKFHFICQLVRDFEKHERKPVFKLPDPPTNLAMGDSFKAECSAYVRDKTPLCIKAWGKDGKEKVRFCLMDNDSVTSPLFKLQTYRYQAFNESGMCMVDKTYSVTMKVSGVLNDTTLGCCWRQPYNIWDPSNKTEHCDFYNASTVTTVYKTKQPSFFPGRVFQKQQRNFSINFCTCSAQLGFGDTLTLAFIPKYEKNYTIIANIDGSIQEFGYKHPHIVVDNSTVVTIKNSDVDGGNFIWLNSRFIESGDYFIDLRCACFSYNAADAIMNRKMQDTGDPLATWSPYLNITRGSGHPNMTLVFHEANRALYGGRQATFFCTGYTGDSQHMYWKIRSSKTVHSECQRTFYPGVDDLPPQFNITEIILPYDASRERPGPYMNSTLTFTASYDLDNSQIDCFTRTSRRVKYSNNGAQKITVKHLPGHPNFTGEYQRAFTKDGVGMSVFNTSCVANVGEYGYISFVLFYRNATLRVVADILSERVLKNEIESETVLEHKVEAFRNGYFGPALRLNVVLKLSDWLDGTRLACASKIFHPPGPEEFQIQFNGSSLVAFLPIALNSAHLYKTDPYLVRKGLAVYMSIVAFVCLFLLGVVGLGIGTREKKSQKRASGDHHHHHRTDRKSKRFSDGLPINYEHKRRQSMAGKRKSMAIEGGRLRLNSDGRPRLYSTQSEPQEAPTVETKTANESWIQYILTRLAQLFGWNKQSAEGSAVDPPNLPVQPSLPAKTMRVSAGVRFDDIPDLPAPSTDK